MFDRRSAHKPSDAFLRDFQRKFSGVTTIPYTLGAGIVPEQPAQWNTGVGTLPGLVSNPTLIPSPLSSSSPRGLNCSSGGFDGRMCTVLPDDSVPQSSAQPLPCHVGAGPFLMDPAYTLPQDLRGFQPDPGLQYQDHPGDLHGLPTHDPREISPPDSQLGQGSPMDETHTEALRFQVTVHAPTATYNPARQVPVTYLNRRQGYKISIVDTAPPVTLPHPVRYRTRFRIGFDNEGQRADPAAAWRLWRDNRGLTEASRSDGELRAVEFVDVMSNVIRGRLPGSQVALESSALDGFSIVWLADPRSGYAGCEAHILFNFLSTDFTLSKGVQGAPLRLYAKTEMIATDASVSPGPSTAEICYCKVKLFRDHGSERKLANDAVQLRKAIDKVQQRLDNLESGATQVKVNTGKRKRGKASAASRQQMETCLTTTHDFSASDELRKVLADLEGVLSSAKPRSMLLLRGDAQDDPDQFPIVLSNPLRGLPAVNPRPVKRETESSSPTSSFTHNHNPAVACFYILRRIDGEMEDYYHAMYLNERNLSDFLRHLCEIYQLEVSSISHLIRVNPAGLRIVIDDDVIREIPHGQDMIVEFSPDADRIRVTLFY